MTELDEPVFVSQIVPETDKTAKELQDSKIRQAVQARQCRRQVMAANDKPVGSPDLYERLSAKRKADTQARTAKRATKALSPAEAARRMAQRKMRS